jgi:hypothetical protein
LTAWSLICKFCKAKFADKSLQTNAWKTLTNRNISCLIRYFGLADFFDGKQARPKPWKDPAVLPRSAVAPYELAK